ncbi:uncharacterized protein [Oscarella lobularis]|uniref:uncharacterized protein isoform X2 n=1 Tax=Oscarella lobularis TaxID=121494 RepID=UPI0033137F5F
MGDPKWKERLIPVMPQAVSSLARIITADLMDVLFAKGYLTRPKYVEMIAGLRPSTVDPSESSRDLFIILMRCPFPSFDDFCSMLKEFQGGDQLLRLLTSSASVHVTQQGSESWKGSESLLSTPQRFVREGVSRIPRAKKSSQIRLTSKKTLMEPRGSCTSKALSEPSVSDSRNSGEADQTGPVSPERVIVHVHKALEKEFEPYRNSVEGLIRDVIETKTKRIEVKFGFIDGMPFSVPLRQEVEKGESSIEISLQCVLRIYLPKTDKECFLKHKDRLLCTIHSLLGYENIEILHGSCDVFLTLRGMDFIRFVSDLRNSRVLISFIQLDTDTEIQLGNLKSIKVTHLLRQSSLLPVAEAFSTIKQFYCKATEKDREVFAPSRRLLSVYSSLNVVADDGLKYELRLKVMQTTLEETARVQCKPDFAFLETKQFLTKELLMFWSEAILEGQRRSEAVRHMLSSTIRKVEKVRNALYELDKSRKKKPDFHSEAMQNFPPYSLDLDEEDEKEAFPRPRHGHVAAFIGNRMLLWGGVTRQETGEVELCSNEFIMSLNLCTNKWSERQSTWDSQSDLPVPLTGASVAVVNDRYAYQYGGMRSSSDSVFCNGLHKLDGFTLKWQKVALASEKAHPAGRRSFGLCALGSKEDRQLVMTGGWGKSDDVFRVPGSDWISAESGSVAWNNELWLFSVAEAIWVPVACKGKSPSARSAFSFTKIDDYRALLVGGVNDKGLLGDAFVFELNFTEWSEILFKGPSSLRPRRFHSTVVCNIPEVGPTAFVLWGYDENTDPIPFGHMIALDSFKCTKILTRDGVIATGEQTTCCFSTKSHVFLFRSGGQSNRTTLLGSTRMNFDILKINLKNLTEEIDTHDSKRPICRFVPAIVSSTYKNNLPDQLSPRDIDRASGLIGSRWSDVARAVFPIFSDKEIRDIETGFLEDRGFHFLLAWLEKNKREATRRALCRALFEVDLRQCVAEVFPDVYLAMTKKVPLDFLPQIQRNELVYDKSDYIGGGEFGEVYQAKLTKSGKEKFVAVKVFSMFDGSGREKEMFENEATVFSCIEPHPHVLRSIGVCSSLGYFAVVTELINGGDLYQLLDGDDEAIRGLNMRIAIARQIALGMAHLHYNYPPIVHLNLKPHNVLVEKVGKTVVCKVTGFCLSKMNDVDVGSDEGSIPFGTASFIAPERYHKEPYGFGSKQLKKARKADVYSYGVVLWVIREKCLPYQGVPEVVIRYKAEKGITLPKGRAKAEAPKRFNDLLNSCTEPYPEDRPTFRTVILMLNEYFPHIFMVS